MFMFMAKHVHENVTHSVTLTCVIWFCEKKKERKKRKKEWYYKEMEDKVNMHVWNALRMRWIRKRFMTWAVSRESLSYDCDIIYVT